MHTVIFDLDETVFASDTALHDDVQALLAILGRLGARIGAVTNGDHRILVRLEEAGIRHHFDGIICTSHVDEPKTEAGIEHLLRTLGSEAHQTALVSHTRDDMAMAKRAGIAKTIAVLHGPVHKHSQYDDADYTVENIATVLDVLE